MEVNEEWVEMGLCWRPHGIKGAMEWSLHNPEDTFIGPGTQVLLMPLPRNEYLPPEGKIYEIQEIHFGNKIRVFLKGVPDRTAAEQLSSYRIYCHREDFPELAEGEYYIRDLITLDAYSPSGKKIGYVESGYETPAHIVLKIRGDKQYWDVPFVDAFVHEVDIEEGRIVLTVPEDY